MQNNDTGILLHAHDIKLTRQWFKEMVRLIGINVFYFPASVGTKHYTTKAEFEASYKDAFKVGVIFEEHPAQQTLKKLGWLSELQENASIIHVDYDLPELEQGAMFVIPSGLDNGKGRLFRVTRLTTDIVYPASVICEIVPEYEDRFTPETSYDYSENSYTLLNREESIEVPSFNTENE